jgi:hypothetical protein
LARTEQLIPVDLRHIPIDQQNVGSADLLEALQGLAPVSRLEYVKANLAEYPTYDASYCPGVIDDQRAHVPPLPMFAFYRICFVPYG